MARKKQTEKLDKENLPEPELVWVDGKSVITDGWIDGSRFIIREQPSSDKPFRDVARVRVENVRIQLKRRA
ncbi:hypothetical protein LI064_01695 [Clostridium perfringens]|uniref:hypothetical protein n=1 Tax=Clostridium perfringens TaxID=1502 RepID=UPI0022469C93|nr:hypothetical protein [Clostridium perfringens]MCX0353235.1 hypothetical protein [Clostridium perfringens]